MESAKTVREKYLKICADDLADTAKWCKNVLPEEEESKILSELESVMKEYVILDIKGKESDAAMEKTRNHFKKRDDDSSISMKEYYENVRKETEKPITDEDIEDHTYMRQFVGISVDHFREVSLEFVPPVDPITKKRIKNPVRNEKCGHVYDYDSMSAFIKSKNVRCPYIGCKALTYIELSDLIPDEELKKRIEDFS